MVQNKKKSKIQLVSIVMPVYNERKTIEAIVKRVQKTEIFKELIIVDDGSNDGTREWLQERFGPGCGRENVRGESSDQCLAELAPVQVIVHSSNQGKGAALKTGFQNAKGSILIVQDADLEYDPQAYPRLLEPLLTDQADVVYGSRFLGEWQGTWPLISYWGNKMFTGLANALTGLAITDVWTGYKVLKKEVLEAITLEESGFDMELELTLKIAQQHWRITEVPISYAPRSKADGKKIRWRDGLQSIRTLYRYRTRRLSSSG